MVAPANKRILLESDKGVADGLATLDSESKLTDAQVPERLSEAALNANYVSPNQISTPNMAALAAFNDRRATV